MKRALLVLFAVASLAGCSDSTGTVSADSISLHASKVTQTLVITNSSDSRIYYFYYVGDASATDFAFCAPERDCDSIPAHTSLNIHYADLTNVIPGPQVVTFFYWRSLHSASGDFGTEPQALRVSLE